VRPTCKTSRLNLPPCPALFRDDPRILGCCVPDDIGVHTQESIPGHVVSTGMCYKLIENKLNLLRSALVVVPSHSVS
jgi:hypothetical protein